jgi:lysophospholipase L1-like esterase
MLTSDVTSSIVSSMSRPPYSLNARHSAVIPDPTTVSFTSAQFTSGFAGSLSTTKNAARVYAYGALTLWCGWITGTEAKLTSPSDYGDNAGSMQVSVDGAAFTSAPNSASVYTLFTGLPHATRFVQIRWVVQMGDAPYVASSGNVLSVTGQPPALVTAANWIQAGSDSATGLYSAGIIPNASGFTPPLQAPSNTTNGSNVGSVKIKGAFTKIVATAAQVGVSKNGGTPTFYTALDEADGVPRAVVIPCDGSVATYNVWDGGNFRLAGGHFSVSGNATLLDIGVRRKLDQFGDSITYGSGPSATSVNTETMHVAAALGFVGSTNGVSGQTIVGGKATIDAALALKTVTSNDVAILALGGNSAGEGIDITEQLDYALCIDKLLAKGYGKVLCRGILPNAPAQSLVDAANVTLKAVMDAKADARLIWIDTITWTGFETLDNTHPTASGYLTLAGYAIPAYTAALGL